MHPIVNNYHRFRSLLLGVVLLTMAALVLAACSSGGGGSGGSADLVIEPTVDGWDFQITASTNSVVGGGDSFTLTAVVSNASGANEPTPASTLIYYQSSDATISSGDTSLGADAVAALAVAAMSTYNIGLMAPTTAGTVYYGACMPPTGNELNASDNCSAGVAVTVSSDWDFQVATSANSTSVGGGDWFTLTAVVSNASNALGPAPVRTLRYYRSDDSTVSSSDSQIGTDAVPSLAVGAASTQSISIQIIGISAGTYHYGACMPATSGEADATDNCSGVAVTVSGWDFVVSASVSSTSVAVGDTFTMTAVVSNNADANEPTPESTLSYYMQSGSTFTFLGEDTVPGLAVGAESTQDIGVTAPAIAGTYSYTACVLVSERDLDPFDNCSTGATVTVGGWDFVVDASVSSTSVEVGETFTLTAMVTNDAGLAKEPTPESTLTYYVQIDGFTMLGVDTVPSLAVGAESTQSIEVMAPAIAGTYGYLVCIPDTGRELYSFDNCTLDPTVTVTEASGGG